MSPSLSAHFESAISERARAEIARDLTEIACSHGDGEQDGTAPQHMVNRRANVRAGRNACIGTLIDLLAFNGRGEEFGAKLSSLAPHLAHTIALRDALLLEVDVKCDEMPTLARVLSGEQSGPELLELRNQLVGDRMALDLAIDAIDSEMNARRNARAAA